MNTEQQSGNIKLWMTVTRSEVSMTYSVRAVLQWTPLFFLLKLFCVFLIIYVSQNGIQATENMRKAVGRRFPFR